MARSAVPPISFADLEFIEQGVFLDPLLRTISHRFDQHAEMVEKVRLDRERGLNNPATGRTGLTPPQVLRSLVLMRVQNWDYRELRQRIADRYTRRAFPDFRSQPVPKHDAFHRAFNRLTPQTRNGIHDFVIRAAVDLGLEDGSQLRVDTTVVQTDIHHPTDNMWLWDTVRVIPRLVGRLVPATGLRGRKRFHNRTRAARRRLQEIQRMTAKPREQPQTKKYRELIDITQQVVDRARAVIRLTQTARGKGVIHPLAIDESRRQIAHYCQLGDRVIDQARRRVLEGEPVPTAEKIYSIFEPHTDVIQRGNLLTPVEFGPKVFLAESAQGLITDYEVLDGNPSDEDHVQPALDRHPNIFGCTPDIYSADRGFHREENVPYGEQEQVQVVCIPQRGGKKTPQRQAYEKSPACKQGQRFRAGIEGTISMLFRGRGRKRCLAEGHPRFKLFVGAAVLANNLMRLAALLMKQSPGRKSAA